MKLTKTEEKLIRNNLNRHRPAGYPISCGATVTVKSNRPGSFGGRPFRTSGIREYNACKKLVERGLATLVNRGGGEILIHLRPEALEKIGYEYKRRRHQQ